MKESIKKEESDENFKSENILRIFYKTAKEKLHSGDLKGAYSYFFKAESVFGCAYCKFLEGNIDESFVLLNLIKNSSPVVDWILCLIGIINGDKSQIPTYFQIRNFYEFDMNMLILYGNNKFAKIIIDNLSYLSKYNKEIYKLTARVFMDKQMYKNAYEFLKKSIEIYYNDPEVHFMMGDLYLNSGKKDNAIEEYKKSNEVTGMYFPAIKKLKEICC